jgi:signal transduction histidine kinase/ligand-binding sensor domain-containing protein
MKWEIRLAFIVFLFTNFQTATAQNNAITFYNLDSINGSPLGKITGITQDTSGYMWFCGQGQNCLYRFDGTSIIRYKHDNKNPNSLGFNFLLSVYADKDGMIWVGGNGLDRFDPATGVFTHYMKSKPGGNNLDAGIVSAILKDHEGHLWIGRFDGLDRLDEKTGKFTHFKNDPGNPKSLSNNMVRSVYEDHKGVIWVGTGDPWDTNHPDEGGLNRFNADGTFARYFHDPKNPHSLINNKVRVIFEDSKGNFWIGTSGDGLQSMDREKSTFERHLFEPKHPEHLSRSAIKRGDISDHITFICEDSSHAIWIGTYLGGISRYDPLSKITTRFRSGNGFPDSTTWNGFISRDGIFWVSTELSTTLYRADPLIKTISFIKTGEGVHGILEDRSGIWVATEGGGLLQFDENKKLVRQFKHSSTDVNSLFNDSLFSIYKRPGEDTLWLGGQHGVEVMNSTTKKFTRLEYYGKPPGWFDYKILNINADRDGNLWIGSFGGGLLKYNFKNGQLKQWISSSGDSGSLGSDLISTIYQDKEGIIWVATIAGKGAFNKLNRQTEKFQNYLPVNIGIYMYEEANGELWAGTQTGLFHYIRKDDQFIPFFDSQSDIGNQRVYGITADNENNLWLSSPSAIFKINRANDGYISYGRRFGINDRSINPTSILKTSKGEILIGSESGYFAFFPRELSVSSKPLKLLITDFYFNRLEGSDRDSSRFLADIEKENRLSLSYGQNNFGFKFIAFDYGSPKAIKYYTMLENFDPEWHESGLEKSVYYFNLAPGDYIFHVKAYSSNESRGERQIRIHISPPWWKTWWAYGLYCLLLMSGLFMIVRIQKERVLRTERHKTQTRELAQAKEIEKAYTELKATQAQLIQSEKMASLGELTAGIAHEIQNPLNFVNNFSEVNMELTAELKTEVGQMEMKPGDKHLLDEFLESLAQNEEKINHHGRRADAIVKGMLQHSRISSGQKEPTDINQLADEYLRLAYHGLRAKDKSFNVTLKTSLDKNIGKINIVPQDIGRVLLNLYNNAFYAVNEKRLTQVAGYEPLVELTSQKSGNKVEVIIKDNGNGIPQKILDKIFQPFFTTKPTGQGTGLGLSLSFDIVKAHGGEVKVETVQSEFTTFIICLPV